MIGQVEKFRSHFECLPLMTDVLKFDDLGWLCHVLGLCEPLVGLPRNYAQTKLHKKLWKSCINFQVF